MGSIIPCMAAQPPQLPINDPMSIPSVGDSIPKRDSYDTDEEYHIALTTWKREGVNHITSHIQSHVLSGTMTPELMERFNSEIEKINFLQIQQKINQICRNQKKEISFSSRFSMK